MSAKKGGQWEREFAKQLSLWWSGNTNDGIFMRTGGSGARATFRSKKGLNTKYQYGDITFNDPIGEPLIDLFTIECKKGYTHETIAALFDKPEKLKRPTQYEQWFPKIVNDAKEAGSASWMLVTKRDYRDPLIFIPMDFCCQTEIEYYIKPCAVIGWKDLDIGIYKAKIWFEDMCAETIKEMGKSGNY